MQAAHPRSQPAGHLVVDRVEPPRHLLRKYAFTVLLADQHGERVLAEEWARRLDTINYEVTCGISRRVPRVYHRDGVPQA